MIDMGHSAYSTDQIYNQVSGYIFFSNVNSRGYLLLLGSEYPIQGQGLRGRRAHIFPDFSEPRLF